MDKYEIVKDICSGNFGVARLVRNKETKELVTWKYATRLLLLTVIYEFWGFDFIPTGSLGARRVFEYSALALVIHALFSWYLPQTHTYPSCEVRGRPPTNTCLKLHVSGTDAVFSLYRRIDRLNLGTLGSHRSTTLLHLLHFSSIFRNYLCRSYYLCDKQS